MHFDLPDLRLFIHVAEAGSLTAGARSASLSTAAASTRMKALESQLGCRLFYRESQGIELTPGGEQLLAHARTIMRQVDYVKADFSKMQNKDEGHIRIFANTTAVTDFMPEILAKFMSERPEVTIDLQERPTNDIFRCVLDGAADIGITSGDILIKGVETIPFSQDRLVVVTSLNHPLSRNDNLCFRDTLDYSYVGLHQGSTIFQFLLNESQKYGLKLPLKMQVYGFEQACRLIEAGVGISILPESSALRYQEKMNLDILEISDDWAVRERFVVVREVESISEICKDLIQEICDHHK